MLSVTLLLAAILLAASLLVIVNAHRAIADEMNSSVTLAYDLIKTNLGSGDGALAGAKELDRLGHLRHLCLSLVRDGEPPPSCPTAARHEAPTWFAAITHPKELPERYIRVAPDQQIRILADPEDEIDEAWHDTRGLLALLLLFYVALLITVYLLLGRAIVPVRRIDSALQRIENGYYDVRLPRFSLPEFDGISSQFNHMASALAAVHAENLRLREHSLRVQEEERRNLARELHDELGQSLTAIQADAASILAKREELPPGVDESATAISEVTAIIYNRTRLMMRRLRPPGLDELGLTAALEEHISTWQRARSDVTFVFTEDQVPADLPTHAAIHVFRLVQEALTNAMRHACARRVGVTLRRRGNRLIVHIVDDGHGFDVARCRYGLGLLGMQERIDLLSGRLRIRSHLGYGTSIHATVPIVRLV